MTTDEDALDRLYGLPLDEFTAGRNELAKELRSRGEREAADEVRRLRKPSRAAWALNQVARGDPKAVRRLLDAGGALRGAQEAVMSGKGGADDLRDAAEDERAAAEPLLAQAGRVLGKGGRGPSAQLLERVRETLHAAAGDEDVARRLQSGRLVEDHRAIGLGAHAGAPAPKPRKGRADGERAKARKEPARPGREPAKPRARGPSAADRRRLQKVAAAKKKLRSAEAGAERARRALAAAEHDRERAEIAFRSADRAFEEARGRAEGADAEVTRLREELEGLEDLEG